MNSKEILKDLLKLIIIGSILDPEEDKELIDCLLIKIKKKYSVILNEFGILE